MGEIVPIETLTGSEVELSVVELPNRYAAEGISEETARYITENTPANTLKAYRTDWAFFQAWCRCGSEDETKPVAGWVPLEPLPASPDTLCQYVRHLVEVDGRKVSTAARRLASISVAHQAANDQVLPPTRSVAVVKTLKALKANHGSRPTKKSAVRTDDLRRMVAAVPDTLRGTRDTAMLTLGFATACRRSELAALDVEDLEETTKGLTILLRRSKTDQVGAGREVAVLYGAHPESCPVRAVRAWLDASGITSGPLFVSFRRGDRPVGQRLSDRDVARVVKEAAERVGLDPAKYAGHSLRRGFVTSAREGGAERDSIRRQTGHKGDGMLDGYIDHADLFRDNAQAYTGL